MVQRICVDTSTIKMEIVNDIGDACDGTAWLAMARIGRTRVGIHARK